MKKIYDRINSLNNDIVAPVPDSDIVDNRRRPCHNLGLLRLSCSSLNSSLLFHHFPYVLPWSCRLSFGFCARMTPVRASLNVTVFFSSSIFTSLFDHVHYYLCIVVSHYLYWRIKPFVQMFHNPV